MSWIRAEVLDGVARRRELILGCILAGLGLWVAAQGGYLLVPAGLALSALGVGWAVLALRRLRFAQGLDAPGLDGPGLVEVDEGQIGYLGPGAGGYVSLVDLVEVRLLRLRGRRVWRLKQADGQALLIPVDAAGADRLFDAFASLPGMDTLALIAHLQPGGSGAFGGTGVRVVALASENRLIWAREGRGVARG